MWHAGDVQTVSDALWTIFASYLRIILTFGFATLAVALVIRLVKPTMTINIIVRNKSD